MAPKADVMLSVLAGFSPRVPLDGTFGSLGSSARTTPREQRTMTPRSRGALDPDLAPLDFDPKYATKIMERRKRAKERDRSLKRAGHDITTLGVQVDAKRMVNDIERDADKIYCQEMQMKAKLFDLVDETVQDRRRQMQKDCIDFSLTNLRKEQRREWSLSDPQQLRKDFPARREGYDVPFSSMQKFEGELAACPEEIKQRKKQMSLWLRSQCQEKQERAAALDEQDKLRDKAYAQSNYLREACELADVQERKEETLLTARENEKLVIDRKARRQAAREKDNAATLAHCANVADFNLMRERHDFDIGSTGRRRDYKRCSYEEEQEMWDTNAALVQKHADEKKALSHVDDLYVEIGMAVDMIGQATEEKMADMNMKRRIQLDSDNIRLAKEQREKALKEKSQYHSFVPTPAE